MATRKRQLRQGWRRKLGSNHDELLAGFEDEDDDEDENEAPCEVARSIRKRSWRRTDGPLGAAVRSERGRGLVKREK
jgi:hypothetical protein